VALTDNGLRRADQPDDVYGTKAYGDSYGWTLSRPLLEVLRPDLDFVGFQQIIAQFHRDPENPERPVSNSPEDIGLRQVPERMVNYARYLHKQLGIPVFVPYLGMPTATWTDSDGSGRIERGEIDGDGWVEEVGRVLSRLHDLEADMRAAGVIGQGTMMLFDDPVHDLGGYQYLLQNEYALGLVATGARDGVPGERYGPEIASKWFRDRSFVELFFGE
jgi:hypothetical protein